MKDEEGYFPLNSCIFPSNSRMDVHTLRIRKTSLIYLTLKLYYFGGHAHICDATAG